MSDEIRKSVSMKMRPSVLKKARLRAVISEKKLGEWMEEAVEEKAAREEQQSSGEVK